MVREPLFGGELFGVLGVVDDLVAVDFREDVRRDAAGGAQVEV